MRDLDYKAFKGTGIPVVSIPACHAGDRGSIPRHGEVFLLNGFKTLTGRSKLYFDTLTIFFGGTADNLISSFTVGINVSYSMNCLYLIAEFIFN